MPQTLLLDDFLTRLWKEGPQGTPFTWLIGAGMSYSAGIPLAVDVSRRLILFEHLTTTDTPPPWPQRDTTGSPYSAQNLDDFLKWYDERDRERVNGTGNGEFARLRKESENWLRSRDGFEDVVPENPQCYPLLFKKILLSPILHHHVLTTLIGRAHGVNLAHLGLAGLLRDHHEWGHTVFTTNFDDLLLKALLTLNHTARVFGEMKSQDSPDNRPTYPQIVHLHGRHTGYRLLNTSEQLSRTDESLQQAFVSHLGNSHLIVLGYSGWDDLGMRTLKRWLDHEGLLKGDLFWVPWKSEATILDPIRDFLKQCPRGRVHVIENKAKDLDADSFMLAMCNGINRRNGGFEPYRREIIEFAQKQHKFTLDQLAAHPGFDPLQAVKLTEDAVKHCIVGTPAKARELIADAKRRVKGADIPDAARAATQLWVGVTEMMLGDHVAARDTLAEALPRWDRVDDAQEHPGASKASNLLALGESYLQLALLTEANDLLGRAAWQFQQDGDAVGHGIASKSHAEAALRSGKTAKARDLLDKGWENLREAPEVVRADAHRLSGDIARVVNELGRAETHYRSALELFRSAGDELGIANTLKALGDVALKANADEAADLYEQAGEVYDRIGSALGRALVEHAQGDVHARREEWAAALSRYERAEAAYARGENRHARCNALADLLVCRKEMAAEHGSEGIDELAGNLKTLAKASRNGYAWDVLIEYNYVDPKMEKYVP
jgi:tetratricopeptide (TPR) repeat protein